MDYPRRAVPSMSGLIAFEATARHMSFSRAAEDLALTQGAVSKRVQQLEQVLGVSLLARNTHRVFLTEVGAAYLGHVRKLLLQLQLSTDDVQSRISGKVTINLALPTAFAVKWLVPRLSAFYQAYPDCVINLSTFASIHDLDLADADCVISELTMPLREAQTTLFAVSPEVSVASPRYIAELDLQTPGDLSRAALLRCNRDPHLWSEWFAGTGRNEPLAEGARFDDMIVLIEAVLHGQGAAVLPKLLIEDDLYAGRLKNLFPERTLSDRCYSLSVRRRANGSDPVRAFQSWLADACLEYRQDEGYGSSRKVPSIRSDPS